MIAAVLNGVAEVPVLREFADPMPADGRCALQVAAAGLNPVDLLAADGKLASAPALPGVVGREGVATGEGGNRYYFEQAVSPYGSIAERTLVAREDLVALPERVADETAIGLGIAGVAAWFALTDHADVQPGQSVLVLGAGGVVGQLVVQLAVHLGASVVTAVTRRPRGKTLALGARHEISLGDGDAFVKPALDAVRRGYDVAIDLLWGRPAAAALATLADRGKLVQVGSSAGATATISAAALRGRQLTVIGHANPFYEPGQRRAAYGRMIQLALAGELTVAAERMPMSRIADAWRRQREGPGRKLVLVPGD